MVRCDRARMAHARARLSPLLFSRPLFPHVCVCQLALPVSVRCEPAQRITAPAPARHRLPQ